MKAKMYPQIFAVFIILFPITMASENSVQVLRANADFGKNLYQILANNESNIIFSPLSAHTILALAYQGAAGKTAESFASTLNLPEAKSAATGYKEVMSGLNNVQNVTLRIANKVYIKTGCKLKDSFGQVARDSFYSEVEQVNFAQAQAAASTINSWVEGKTNNKIKNLFNPSLLDSVTSLVLVNAIYFKGSWKHPFDKADTKNKPFYLNDQDKIEVPMMFILQSFNYSESQELDAKILELPYINEDLSLVIVLPNQKNGIKALEQKMATTVLTTLTKNLHRRLVQVTLPRFKIESKIDLKPILKKMGLGVIFTDDANFTGLLESSEPLVVSEAIQQAFIEVNEEGSEAAAATRLLFYTLSVHPTIVDFVADHPFIFFLTSGQRENILFEGRVSKPSS